MSMLSRCVNTAPAAGNKASLREGNDLCGTSCALVECDSAGCRSWHNPAHAQCHLLLVHQAGCTRTSGVIIFMQQAHCAGVASAGNGGISVRGEGGGVQAQAGSSKQPLLSQRHPTAGHRQVLHKLPLSCLFCCPRPVALTWRQGAC